LDMEYANAGYNGKHRDEYGNIDEDDVYYEDMKDRDSEIRTGIGLVYQGKYGIEVRGKINQDISGKSNSLKSKFGVQAGYPIMKKLFFIAEVESSYYSKEYVDYYYGVRPEEVKSDIGRNLYIGEAAIVNSVSYGFLYFIKNNFNVMLLGKTEFLPNEIQNSPMVNDSKTNSVILMFNYKIY